MNEQKPETVEDRVAALEARAEATEMRMRLEVLEPEKDGDADPLDEIRSMSEDEINQDWERVQAVLAKAGR